MGKTAVKGRFHLILIATTFALAVVTIIASRSGHYHPEHSTIMPLLGLAVPVLLVSCLIVALCWALARRKWAFVTLAAFFFLGRTETDNSCKVFPRKYPPPHRHRTGKAKTAVTSP